MAMSPKAKVYVVLVLEGAAIIAILPLFSFTVHWNSAIPAEVARQESPDLEIDPNWINVTIGAGKAREWPHCLASEDPGGFALCLFGLAAQVGLVFALHLYRWHLTKKAYGEEPE